MLSMGRRDIVEGLKRAVARGEDLKSAMMSFYNAGYTKEEVEDAARDANYEIYSAQTGQPMQMQGQVGQSSTQQAGSPAQVQNQQQRQAMAPMTVQKVSSYSPEKPKQKGMWIIWVLIALVVLLVLGLIGIFVFQEQVAAWFA